MKALSDYINEAADINSKIINALKSKESFCLYYGELGARKKSHLNDLAKRNGYDNVLRIYLDDAEIEDLAGTPGKGGTTCPKWMNYIIDNDKSQFVLMFCGKKKDFTPKVYNALMPIVLDNKLCGKKCDNFIVCFASDESLQDDMPRSMKSEFTPNFFTL